LHDGVQDLKHTPPIGSRNRGLALFGDGVREVFKLRDHH
jgi:hypothetical protein